MVDWSNVMRAGIVTRIKVRAGVCEVLVEKRNIKRPIGRARCKRGLKLKGMLWKSVGGLELHCYGCVRIRNVKYT